MAAADSLRATALSEEHTPDQVSESVSKPAASTSIRLKIDKLRADAAECVLISSLATDSQKRVFFEKLAAHLTDLASEIETLLM